MFVSMTGFGSSTREFSWGVVSVEITSVNHKYQDFSVRLPRELSSLENKIISQMRNSITRGKVRLTAEITFNPGANIPTLDGDSLMNFINQARKIAMRNYLDIPKDITKFLVIPGILDFSENAAEQAAHETPEIWDEIISDAISSLMEMKKSEGEKLKEKISGELSSLEKILSSMAERWKVAQSEALEGLRTRYVAVMEKFSLEIDEARISEEVAIMSDKWDVSEELARMEAHTGKFRQIMDGQESAGKKLDFLVQEMNREVNTMGSKVLDADFRWGVVEAKTCIERIREQLQNIE